MMRLILFTALISAVVLAITVMLGNMRDLTHASVGKDNAMIPARMRRITYVLLVVLLFGVSTGWLGGA